LKHGANRGKILSNALRKKEYYVLHESAYAFMTKPETSFDKSAEMQAGQG
jgi:hypothetical protein